MYETSDPFRSHNPWDDQPYTVGTHQLSYPPAYGDCDQVPHGAYEMSEYAIDDALGELHRNGDFASEHGSSPLRSLLLDARSLGAQDLFVWGPRLVTAILSGQRPRYANTSLEDRRSIASLVERIMAYGHRRRGLDPQWQIEAEQAFQQARTAFLANATEAELAGRARRAALLRLVGGDESAMRDLDTEPLPAEDLDLSVCPEDLRERVARVDQLIGTGLAGLLEDHDEVRTITRRILLRLATVNPSPLRRPSRDDLIAGGIAVLSAQASGYAFDNGSTRADIIARLGTTGACVERGRYLVGTIGVRLADSPRTRLAGVDDAWQAYGQVMCDPVLQTGATRRLLRATYEALDTTRTAALRSVPVTRLREEASDEQ